MTNEADLASLYLHDRADFLERASGMALGDLSRYYWYHTVDLGNGLVTPGLYDYRDTISDFGFPADMGGMSVLDAGSATGFFAFEFEKRGARVLSVELPSLRDLDRFPGQDLDRNLRKIERMIFPDTADKAVRALRREDEERELYWCLLEGPFSFCKQQLRSQVERCYSTIYNLSEQNTGNRNGFDLVFAGDILVHTLNPLEALAALAPLCKGTLVLAQSMPGEASDAPAMLYRGGSIPGEDELCWWLPNKSCMIELLKKFGFRSVEDRGTHRGYLRPTGYSFERAVLHAHR